MNGQGARHVGRRANLRRDRARNDPHMDLGAAREKQRACEDRDDTLMIVLAGVGADPPMQVRRNTGGGEESQQQDQQDGTGHTGCEASRSWAQLDEVTSALH
jgi:hypothetical protein